MASKKPKSKRVGTAQRAKIHRKVKEHHRKLRKESKKNPQNQATKKDPGIPKGLPFETQVLKEVEAAKERIQIEKQRRRQIFLQSKERKQEMNGNDGDMADTNELVSLANLAMKRGSAFDNNQEPDDEAPLLVNQENSKRAFYKEFRKVVQEADIILQVLDARDPLGSRDKEIEHWIQENGRTRTAGQHLALVLNKSDLIPKENAQAWLKYLKNEYPTVLFSSTKDRERSVEHLLQFIKGLIKEVGGKSVVVGIIGLPNAGKSSLINALKRSKACPVGATPGLTKHAQMVHLDGNIKLMDSPGIVFQGSSDEGSLLRNCIRVEQLEDPISPVEKIVAKTVVEDLLRLYGISEFSSVQEFLRLVAVKYGKLGKGGVPLLEASARIVLQDWNNGKIPYYSIPPSRDHEQLGASIQTAFSPEFVIDKEKIIQ